MELNEQQKAVTLPKITIVDGVCGSGKTQGIIQYMKEHDYKRYIYFTPFISECHRIAGTQERSEKDDSPKTLKSGEYVYDKPSIYNCVGLNFKHPKREGQGQKKSNFLRLVNDLENIVSTHSMLTNIGADVQEIISQLPYTCILDEVVDPIQKHKISPNNKKDLFEHEYVYLDSDGVSLRWNYERYPESRKAGDNYYKEQKLCDSGNLIMINGKVMLWEMSESLFKCFTEVKILTYQFEGSMLEWFFKAKGIQYQVERLAPPKGVKYGDLINIIEDERLNAIGEPHNALSATQTKGLTAGQVKQLRSNLNYLRKNAWAFDRTNQSTKGQVGYLGVKSRMFTCINSAKDKLAVDGFKTAHVVFNIRGSNAYRHVENCAYFCNVYLHPEHEKYFNDLGVSVDEETYALNSLLQWLFRSRLRDKQSINVYIPSKRMRDLLMEWCLEN